MFETEDSRTSSKLAVVNQPSVFESLKFYCNYFPLIDKKFVQGGNVPAILNSVVFFFSDVLVCRYSRNT